MSFFDIDYIYNKKNNDKDTNQIKKQVVKKNKKQFVKKNKQIKKINKNEKKIVYIQNEEKKDDSKDFIEYKSGVHF